MSQNHQEREYACDAVRRGKLSTNSQQRFDHSAAMVNRSRRHSKHASKRQLA